MSSDLSIRRSTRIPDSAESNSNSEDKILKDPAENSQQAIAPATHRNQNAEVANARKAEAGMMPNQLQSQLLNQTISTGTPRSTNQQSPKAGGTSLQTALKMYGITNEQLQRYASTGEEPEGLKKAINDAKTKGDWPALNIVRASFQMRADYIRANSSPNDKEIRAYADRLDSESASLTQNRTELQLNRAMDRLELSKRSTRPDKIQQQMEQGSKVIENVGSEIEKKIKPRK